MAAGTSDSGDVLKRLLFRARKALEERGVPSAQAGALGAPGGYHWIIMTQVARYGDSNARLTNTRRGIEGFIDALAQSRRNLPPAQVRDTLTVWPYHFSILGDKRGAIQPLAEALRDTSNLKKSVAVSPQDDEYQGRKWSDGHDWRAALQKTLGWMEQNDLDPKSTILLVLDWNDLAQAPQTLSDGTRPETPATDKDLVLESNPQRFAAFAKAMGDAGLNPKQSLETVQVGNLEYDMSVFAPQKLEPLTGEVAAPTAKAVGATPLPSQTEGNTGGGGSAVLLILPLLALLGGALFWVARPVNFRLDEQESRQVAALPARTLPILGKDTPAKGAHYRLPGVTFDTDRPLALIQSDFSKKLLVSNGALSAQNSEGFQSTPTGLKLTGQRGDFDLIDTATGRIVASVSVRKL